MPGSLFDFMLLYAALYFLPVCISLLILSDVLKLSYVTMPLLLFLTQMLVHTWQTGCIHHYHIRDHRQWCVLLLLLCSYEFSALGSLASLEERQRLQKNLQKIVEVCNIFVWIVLFLVVLIFVQ